MKPIVIILLALLGLALLCGAGLLLLRARRKAQKIDPESLVGAQGKVIADIDNLSGAVSVRGSEWAARCVDPNQTIPKGNKVTVVAIEGVRLVCG
ncbi:MAG: NfeD family protein [Clostridia bacterium]|nr:NfeD family protein [Clostridia bacterium]